MLIVSSYPCSFGPHLRPYKGVSVHTFLILCRNSLLNYLVFYFIFLDPDKFLWLPDPDPSIKKQKN